VPSGIGSARGSLIARRHAIYNVNLTSPDGIALCSQDGSRCIRGAESPTVVIRTSDLKGDLRKRTHRAIASEVYL
jgi:hypothetical protein